MKIIYKITYPNWKIYIWKDLTNSINYFWSANRKLIEQDFNDEERKSFTITRDILWSSKNSLDKEVNEKEVEFIKKYSSNNPLIWYNQWPKFKETKYEKLLEEKLEEWNDKKHDNLFN